MNENVIRQTARPLCGLLLAFSLYSPAYSNAHEIIASTLLSNTTRLAPSPANASLVTEKHQATELAKPTETSEAGASLKKQSYLETGTLALLALGMIALGLARRNARND